MGRNRLGRLSLQSWKKLGALAAPFALGCGLVLGSGAAHELSAQRVQQEVLALGGLGLLAFFGACAVRPLFVVISGSLFAVAAGLVWGPWIGTAIALAGSALSTATVYALARALGSSAVRDLAGDRYHAFADAAQRKGFALLLVGSLGFLVPGDVVVAVAAATRLRLRTVLSGCLLGNVPGTLAMAALGATAHRPSAWMIGLGVAAVVALTVAGAWLARSILPAQPRTITS